MHRNTKVSLLDTDRGSALYLKNYIGNTIHSQHARLTKAVNIYTQLGASGSEDHLRLTQARESSNVPMMHEGAQHHCSDSAKKG